MSPASRPLQVLLLTETYRPEIGGGETQAALLAAALRRRGHVVTIATRRTRASLPRRESAPEAEVWRVPPAGRGRIRKWALAVTALQPLLALRRRCDLVLVSGFRILGIPATLVGRLTGLPTFLKADSNGELSGEYFRAGLSGTGLRPDRPPLRWLLAARNALLRRADGFVAVSAAIEQELLAERIPARLIHRIPNCVDARRFTVASDFERTELRRRLGVPGRRVVIYTGRLVSYKGLPMLLRVWREIVARRADATLLLVGAGSGDIHDCEQELRAYVSAHGLERSVQFTGAVDRVQDWLRAADVFVFPTENEAFGLALVEAMACGLAAVTSGVGGILDFARHGENALVVEPADETALRDALDRLLDDEALAAALGAAARETALARFDADAIAAAYETAFLTAPQMRSAVAAA